MLVVYFSNISGNTERFVDKLGFRALKIPIYWDKDPLFIYEPFVLITPSYKGGRTSNAVPKQVIKFLNIESNRNLMRAVVATGNSNFGKDYGIAGREISRKAGVPNLGTVELFGTIEDVEYIKKKIKETFSE